MISEFQGEYRFLSNFWLATVYLDGIPYPTVEYAYVAAKLRNPRNREFILKCESPGKAKVLGRKFLIREDWDKIKLLIMEDLVRQKFTNNQELRNMLLETGDEYLQEGNTWGDTFWGVCRGVGENHLGKIIMKVRDEIRIG